MFAAGFLLCSTNNGQQGKPLLCRGSDFRTDLTHDHFLIPVFLSFFGPWKWDFPHAFHVTLVDFPMRLKLLSAEMFLLICHVFHVNQNS